MELPEIAPCLALDQLADGAIVNASGQLHRLDVSIIGPYFNKRIVSIGGVGSSPLTPDTSDTFQKVTLTVGNRPIPVLWVLGERPNRTFYRYGTVLYIPAPSTTFTIRQDACVN
jgi:hypothetical protein